MQNGQNNPKNVFYVLGIGIYLLFIIFIMNRFYPIVGHDYRYFLPHMVDTYIHQQVNGFSIQWFTPSFGGGLPVFPNPQDIQFTINQILVLILNPWLANLVTISVYALVGYIACYCFGREILELSWMASLLGSLFFTTSGFSIQHNLVGHVGYQMFPLIALFSYILFSQRWKGWQRGIILGSIIAIFIYSAGFYTLIILVLTIIMLIPLVYIMKPDEFGVKKIIIACGVGGITATLLSIGKIYAVMRFLTNFPRVIHDNYYSSVFESFSALIVQLIGVPILTIPAFIFTKNPTTINNMMETMVAGGKYGIWETDVSISPMLALILIYSFRRLPQQLVNTFRNLRNRRKIQYDRVLAILLLLFGILLAFEFTSARGVVYDSIKVLPVLRSLHVNIRFASSFILPLAILGAYLIEKEFKPVAKDIQFKVFRFLFLTTLIWLDSYFLVQPRMLGFDLYETINDYQNVRQDSEYYVTEVMEIEDFEIFSKHATSLYPYEPIFGYSLEQFPTQLIAGPIYFESGGYYNLNHPANFVYGPDEPFARFSVGQETILEKFVNYEQPDWEIPRNQLLYNAISGITFYLILGYTILLFLSKLFILRGNAPKRFLVFILK